MMIFLLRYSFLFTITVLVLTLLSLILAHAFPGDLLTNLSGQVVTSENQKQVLESNWAIHASPIGQFFNYCHMLIKGEWGVSMVSGNSLFAEMARTIPATIELSVYATFIALIIGIPLGSIAGVRAYSKIDHSINGLSIIQNSLPVFWLGLAFILIFCFTLNLLPLSGRLSVLFNIPHKTGFILLDIFFAENINTGAALKNALMHMVLPSIAVGLVSGANLTRLVRRSVIDVLNKPYIASAKSRGLSSRSIFFNHVLTNSLVPILPIASLQITTLITNTMIIEVLFSWPGIGKFLLDALRQQDYSALRMGMLIVSVMVISLTILIDFINRLFDPSKGKKLDVAL